jgi:RDD family
VLPSRISDPRRWITPEPLNVAPQLIGLPLATPQRRAVAMAVDLAVVALLSGVSGFWLVGGLLLVVFQLNSQRGGRTRWRMVVGWAFAALLALLAFQEAVDQWQHRGGRTPEVAAAKWDSTDFYDPTDVADAVDTAGPPASAASATARLSDAQRIARLEAALAEARQPLSTREQLDRWLDSVGASFGWGFVYFSLLPAWWGGQTLGKKLLGLQIVELTGQPMTVMRCLKRYGGYAAGMATGGLGFLQLIWDPNRQGIQDRTAHTVVVDRRAAQRPVLMPPGAEPEPRD